MERNPENPAEFISPMYELGQYQLTYQNTRIRMFSEMWEHLTHVEHSPEGSKKTLGIAIDQDTLDELMTLDFPFSFDPFPDEATKNWYVNRNMNAFDTEVADL